MLQDVAQQKHVISYKNDWLFRQDLGFEPYNGEFPPINLHAPIMYSTTIDLP